MSRTRTVTLATLAMIVFAGSSLMCRASLKHTTIAFPDEPATPRIALASIAMLDAMALVTVFSRRRAG